MKFYRVILNCPGIGDKELVANGNNEAEAETNARSKFLQYPGITLVSITEIKNPQ